MAQLTMPQGLKVNSLEELYQLMGRTFYGDTQDRNFPIIEQQNVTHDLARDIYIAEAKTPRSGIGAGIEATKNRYYVRDGIWDVQAGYYYKDVVTNGQHLQLRVERFYHFFGDSYVLSLRNQQGKIVAEVGENLVPIFGDQNFVKSALTAMGVSTQVTLPRKCRDSMMEWTCGYVTTNLLK